MTSKSNNHDHQRKAMGQQKQGALFPVAPSKSDTPKNYSAFLDEIKKRIQQERIKAVLSANSAMVLLYWDIGQEILKNQRKAAWGSKVIDRLAIDLAKSFPDMKGFSQRNLKYMRAFAIAWPEKAIVQQVAAQIPWFHNCLLLEKVADPNIRIWYINQTIQNSWSRSILDLQIKNELHKRKGKAIHNFELTLPPAQSDMAAQVFKDPYVFDFLGTADPRREAEVEQALIDHVQKFLLELGAGFAFVGRQVHLEVGNEDFYIDLLFYHVRLHCYVVVELKAVAFKPEFIGKLNFYLSATDDLLKQPEDKPTIGLLLVREKNHVVVEYALRDLKKPIGVAGWETKIVEKLPKEFKGCLPSVEEFEKEFVEKVKSGEKKHG